MEDQQLNDDSHYEISLTATQAFVAFVLLLLSLAASFAFGVMVGRGQLDPEAAKVARDADTTQITERAMPATTEESAPVEPVVETAAPEAATEAGDEIEIKPAATAATPAPVATATAPPAQTATSPAVAAPVTAPATTGPVYAQLLATGDAKRAETLAAQLFDAGFTTAFVDRVKGEKGTIHRVRVRFRSDADARAAVPALQKYTTEKVLVTTK
ncbi:MAG: SPOR domain-containing protein [Thermoanaerobaculia bacterium]|nr:SPOR domain-containing protein [Thermoanaerobaculia bacterium]